MNILGLPFTKAEFTRKDNVIGAILSVIFIALNYYNVGPFTFTNLEVWGFVTGAWSVWLLAKNDMWNWAFGIVNGAIFVYLFWTFKLYADAGINMWYVVAGAYGWAFWLFGGKNKTPREITHANWKVLLAGLVFIAAFTGWEYGHLKDLGDTAPFLDGLTTAMSIFAFWMQARKYIENWYVWILADVIYIPLYFQKGLPLTGILYIGFMAMCFYGLYEWFRIRREFLRSYPGQGDPASDPALYHGVAPA